MWYIPISFAHFFWALDVTFLPKANELPWFKWSSWSNSAARRRTLKACRWCGSLNPVSSSLSWRIILRSSGVKFFLIRLLPTHRSYKPGLTVCPGWVFLLTCSTKTKTRPRKALIIGKIPLSINHQNLSNSPFQKGTSCPSSKSTAIIF